LSTTHLQQRSICLAVKTRVMIHELRGQAFNL
jgi:hypothetical protein